MAGRLQGKVAVITGASRGLGQYVAVGYAKAVDPPSPSLKRGHRPEHEVIHRGRW